MTFVSWNVAGLRAAMKKGCYKFIYDTSPDVLLLQEVKIELGKLEFNFPGYYTYWNSADVAGYSGTALLTKKEPLAIHYDTINDTFFGEGRVIVAEFLNFYVVCLYNPNTGSSFQKLEYRLLWDREFRQLISGLDRVKPVIVGGDFNVAAEDLDCYDPKLNRGSPSFTNGERYGFELMTLHGFIDAHRALYPWVVGVYSCWSSLKARDENKGVRLDYFVVSRSLKRNIENIVYCADVYGSDHCPVFLEMQ